MAGSQYSIRGYVWKDTGWAAIKKNVLRGPAVTHVRAGVVGSKADETHPESDDLTLGEVATIQEFGNSHQPARPFLRTALVWDRGAHREMLHTLAQATRRVMFQGI